MDHSIQTATVDQVATISRRTIDVSINEHPGIARTLYIACRVDDGTLRAWIVSLGWLGRAWPSDMARAARQLRLLQRRHPWVGSCSQLAAENRTFGSAPICRG